MNRLLVVIVAMLLTSCGTFRKTTTTETTHVSTSDSSAVSETHTKAETSNNVTTETVTANVTIPPHVTAGTIDPTQPTTIEDSDMVVTFVPDPSTGRAHISSYRKPKQIETEATKRTESQYTMQTFDSAEKTEVIETDTIDTSTMQVTDRKVDYYPRIGFVILFFLGLFVIWLIHRRKNENLS